MATAKSVLTKWERSLACVSLVALGVSSIIAFFSLSYMNGLASVRVSDLASANQAVAARAAKLSDSIAQTDAKLQLAQTKIKELEMDNISVLQMHDSDVPIDVLKGKSIAYLEGNELALQQVSEYLGTASEDLAHTQDVIWIISQDPALELGAELPPAATRVTMYPSPSPEQLSEQARQNIQAELANVVQTAAQAFENASGDADPKSLRAEMQLIVQSAQAVAEGFGIELETVVLDTGSGAKDDAAEPAAGSDTQ